MSANPTVIDVGAGMIDGAGPITTNPVETMEFDWSSGLIRTNVNLSAGTAVRIQGSGAKALEGQMLNYSGDATWDGKGSFAITGQDSGFSNRAYFVVSRTDWNASILLVAGGWFENQGTLTSSTGRGRRSAFSLTVGSTTSAPGTSPAAGPPPTAYRIPGPSKSVRDAPSNWVWGLATPA
jgi:hypothetical protein